MDENNQHLYFGGPRKIRIITVSSLAEQVKVDLLTIKENCVHILHNVFRKTYKIVCY